MLDKRIPHLDPRKHKSGPRILNERSRSAIAPRAGLGGPNTDLAVDRTGLHPPRTTPLKRFSLAHPCHESPTCIINVLGTHDDSVVITLHQLLRYRATRSFGQDLLKMSTPSKNVDQEIKVPFRKRKRTLVIPQRKNAACLPCRKRKIRCAGQGTPCKTCIARRIEQKCEFISKNKSCPDNMAPHEISTAHDLKELLRIRNGRSDTTGSLSTPSTVSTLSELSQTPSLDFSSYAENFDADQMPDGVTFKQPVDALPSWEMIDKLKAQYFAFVFPVMFLHS